jgi:hypothetical protein
VTRYSIDLYLPVSAHAQPPPHGGFVLTAKRRAKDFTWTRCQLCFPLPAAAPRICSVRVIRQLKGARYSGILVAVKTTGVIQHISAVTFAVRDMARSIEFYKKLGFELLYGSDRAGFSSLPVRNTNIHGGGAG